MRQICCISFVFVFLNNYMKKLKVIFEFTALIYLKIRSKRKFQNFSNSQVQCLTFLVLSMKTIVRYI